MSEAARLDARAPPHVDSISIPRSLAAVSFPGDPIALLSFLGLFVRCAPGSLAGSLSLSLSLELLFPLVRSFVPSFMMFAPRVFTIAVQTRHSLARNIGQVRWKEEVAGQKEKTIFL